MKRWKLVRSVLDFARGRDWPSGIPGCPPHDSTTWIRWTIHATDAELHRAHGELFDYEYGNVIEAEHIAMGRLA